ncbi:DUF3375 family protein [Microbacterium trichothecenolyticum]|uniref:DUF3375 family protein n=1 Tax=Microbacterium trichothecenolyticum TaxID=69370 RepID=UPI0027D7BEA6|nr:DUF3375 family protein [Microbacterium trichothecenolyticum]
MDLEEVDRLWEQHPAWRLLRARNAPLVLAFLGERFIDDRLGMGDGPPGQVTSARPVGVLASGGVTGSHFAASSSISA